MLFVVMLLAHLLADYPLQPTWLVMRKHQWPWLLTHGAIVFATLSLLLVPLAPTVWSLILLISGIHIIQDWLKIRVGATLFDAPIIPYFLDQLSHVLILAICSSLPMLRSLQPLLPQTLYVLGIFIVLIGWTFPITMRVARVRTALERDE